MPIYNRGRFAFLFPFFIFLIALGFTSGISAYNNTFLDPYEVFSGGISGNNTGRWTFLCHPSSRYTFQVTTHATAMWSASAQITLFIYTNESISVGLLWSARDIFDGETQADFTDKKRQDFTPISAGEYFIELSMLVKLVGTERYPASISSCEISIFENLPQNLEQETNMSIIIAFLSGLGAFMLFPVIVDCFTYKGLKVEEAEARDFRHSIMRLNTRIRNLLHFKNLRRKKDMQFDEGEKK